VGDFGVFRLRRDRARSPRTAQEHDFVVLEASSWVNVVALTPDGRLVLVEQYRHGTNTVELEIPGGVMDAHDASPIVAGERELQEETGYVGEAAQVIGEVYANPAIQTNRCYTVLVQRCQLRHPPALDQGEDLTTRLVPAAGIPGLIAAGRIRHSLVVAACYYYELWARRAREP
jgi:8-oxo-dGTP pyrophosphatase MutT (NUDIX family)